MSSQSRRGDRQADDVNVVPELVDLEHVSQLCQCSTRHVLRMVGEGRMPAPFKVGRCVRWSRRAIERWVADGCPRIDGTGEAGTPSRPSREARK